MTDLGPWPNPDAIERHIRERLEPFAERYVGLSVGMVVGDVGATVGFGSVGGRSVGGRSDGGRSDGGGAERVPDGETSFQIGSVTKLFTALLLADAVERGEVALDQPVDTLIPGTATHPKGRPYTLQDLATHTSGLPRLPHGLAWQALRNRCDPYAGFTTDHLQETLRREPDRPPGGRARYSNLGFGVLGEALSRAAGASYADLVSSRIARPLQLRHTTATAGRAGASEPDRAWAAGHTRRGKPAVDWDLAALAGAGVLRSTTSDLLAFLRAHLDPPTSPMPGPIATVLEPRVSAGRALRVGLAWHVLENKDGSRWWWHNGGTGGFFSFVGFDPTARTAVVVLSNSARSVDRLGAALLQQPTRST